MSSESQRKEWAIVLMATRGLADFVANALICMERCGIDTNLVEVVFPANAQCELADLARVFGARPRILEQLIKVDLLDMPAEYAEYGSPGFAYVEKYRFPAVRAIMAEGRRVIYTDVDVGWIRNPLPYLSDVLDTFACAMQTEAIPVFPPMFCLGFFALADTSAGFRLIDRFIAKYSQDEAWRILQPLFRDMLSENSKVLTDIFPLPEGLFPNGLLRRVVDSDKGPSDTCTQQLQPFIFHGNWVSGIENKRRLLDDAGVWFAPENRGPFVLGEPIPLFSISDFRLHNGAEATTPHLHIITRDGQWSYALSFIPDQAVLQSAYGDREMTISVELCVDEGVIGVGLLRSDGREFITEKVIRPGGNYRTITLRASTSEKFSEIVLRNCSTLGMPSRATVRSIETRLLNPRDGGMSASPSLGRSRDTT